MRTITDLRDLIEGLNSGDDKYAYRCLKLLEEESSRSDTVYPFFDTLVEMLDDPKSYVRTRALILVAANARWDTGNRIDEIIDSYLKHILDDKPITARQCIKALPLIAISAFTCSTAGK